MASGGLMQAFIEHILLAVHRDMPIAGDKTVISHRKFPSDDGGPKTISR